jgi:hypothetical protein
MKTSLRIAAALLLAGLSCSAAAAVTATLDRDQVEAGETVQLILQHDSRGGGEPDLEPLKKDFDLLDRSSSSSVQIVNGSISSQRELRLSLAPKHAGKLQIPPLSWDGEQSQPLQLTVGGSGGGAGGAQAGASGAGAAAAAGNAHVFLSSSLDQKQPYVQGGVLLTVKLYTDEQLYQPSLDFAGSNDIMVQRIGKDQQGNEVRNGRRYDVVERQYLLQPQRSGELSLDGPTLEAQVVEAANPGQSPFGANPFGGFLRGSPFGGMMQTTRPLRLHGDAIQLSVRPRPADAAGPDWLPAKQVNLEEAWRPDNASVHAGEPLTLHLRLAATGLSAAQLPDLSAGLALPDGIKAYPDQPKLETGLQSGEIVASREQDIALIASRPGQYRIPALRLSWWDTKQNVQRQVLLPERTLDVLPALPGSGDAAAAAPPAASAPPALSTPAPAAPADSGPTAAPPIPAGAARPFPWPWISLFLVLLWLGTLVVWWRERAVATAPVAAAPAQPAADTGNLRSAFRAACLGNDPQAARRSLLAWARAVWPQHPPAGLNALSAQLRDPRVAELLQQLDRACYSGGAWHGEELAQALGSLAAPAKTAVKSSALSELYP